MLQRPYLNPNAPKSLGSRSTFPFSLILGGGGLFVSHTVAWVLRHPAEEPKKRFFGALKQIVSLRKASHIPYCQEQQQSVSVQHINGMICCFCACFCYFCVQTTEVSAVWEEKRPPPSEQEKRQGTHVVFGVCAQTNLSETSLELQDGR